MAAGARTVQPRVAGKRRAWILYMVELLLCAGTIYWIYEVTRVRHEALGRLPGFRPGRRLCLRGAARSLAEFHRVLRLVINFLSRGSDGLKLVPRMGIRGVRL